MAKTARTTISCGFGSLMDIDKLIPRGGAKSLHTGFGSLMDIDKLIPWKRSSYCWMRFGSLMDIDKLIRIAFFRFGPLRFGSLMDIDKLILRKIITDEYMVLVLGWILINGYTKLADHIIMLFWFSDGYG